MRPSVGSAKSSTWMWGEKTRPRRSQGVPNVKWCLRAFVAMNLTGKHCLGILGIAPFPAFRKVPATPMNNVDEPILPLWPQRPECSTQFVYHGTRYQDAIMKCQWPNPFVGYSFVSFVTWYNSRHVQSRDGSGRRRMKARRRASSSRARRKRSVSS